MTAPEGPRCAVFMSPAPESDFARLGAEWLGRDCWTGKLVGQPNVEGISQATKQPRHYGFHATMRAPFELANSVTSDQLRATLRAFAADQAPLRLNLSPRCLGPFLALQTDEQSQIAALQSELLPVVEPFRAPLSNYDLARRKKAPLTERQIELLEQWGYPYVLDELRFHMTLTGPQSSADLDRFRAAAEQHFAGFEHAADTLGLALFHQPDRQSPFRAEHYFPLGPTD